MTSCSAPVPYPLSRARTPRPGGPTTPAIASHPLETLTHTPFQPVAGLPSLSPTVLPSPTGTPTQIATAIFSPTPTPEVEELAIPTPFPDLSDKDTVNFLLAGSDRRSGASYRTDTLVIVSIRPGDHSVTLLSIPRDLFVYIPGWKMQRINTAYLHGELEKYPGGGPGLLEATILYNLGIRIDHVALVDFDGFRKIVDTLGGVDVPLACPYTDWHIKNPKKPESDPKNWEMYTVGPGVVHMDGDLALWYARSRLHSSDFDRGRRQQEVIRAIYSRALQRNVLRRLPQLYKQFRSTVTTDISLGDLLPLVPLAANLGAPRIRSFYIDGPLVRSWRTPEGAAVLLPKGSKILALVKEALAPPNPDDIQHLSLRVEIANATAHPGWEQLAAERLHYAGYQTTIAKAREKNTSKTLLYDLTAAQDTQQSAGLLAALGLSPSRLRAAPEANSPVAYRLVLGQDYDPCFSPSRLSH